MLRGCAKGWQGLCVRKMAGRWRNFSGDIALGLGEVAGGRPHPNPPPEGEGIWQFSQIPEQIAKFPFVALSRAKGLTAQGEILRFAKNDRALLRMTEGQMAKGQNAKRTE